MNWIVARLKEPSTYAGIASFVAGLSFIPHAADWSAAIVPIGGAIAAVAAIIMPDKKA